jgi:uncharacterized protein (DUF305 family)
MRKIMSRHLLTSLCLAAFALAAPAVVAQHSHSGHTMPAASAKADTGPSSKAFAAANTKMHKDMDIVFSGNTDLDFVRGMIAHHQGAIDMAKVQLEFGKDPAIRKLSEEIIKAQTTEIAMMKDWLAKNGK